MGFRDGAYAKIWKKDVREKFTRAQISISHKNRDTGEYETDFSDYVSFVGNAHKKMADISEGDRVQLKGADVTNSFNKTTGQKYTNFTVFDFEPAGTTNGEPKPEPAKEKVASPEKEASDDELPF